MISTKKQTLRSSTKGYAKWELLWNREWWSSTISSRMNQSKSIMAKTLIIQSSFANNTFHRPRPSPWYRTKVPLPKGNQQRLHVTILSARSCSVSGTIFLTIWGSIQGKNLFSALQKDAQWASIRSQTGKHTWRCTKRMGFCAARNAKVSSAKLRS